MTIYKEPISENSNTEIDTYTAAPLLLRLESEDGKVSSIVGGEVVGAADGMLVIYAAILQPKPDIGEYKIQTDIVRDADGNITSCKWVAPTLKDVYNYYYITYSGIDSKLTIGDTVNAGQKIGKISGELYFNVSSTDGTDIEPRQFYNLHT